MKKVKLWIITLTLLALILTIVGVVFGLQAISKIDKDSQQKVVHKKPPSREELLKLVNQERAKVGVAPLQIDERLNQSAQHKADDMVARNYYSHYDPATGNKNGLDKALELVGDSCVYVSENIVDNGSYSTNSSINAIRAWVSSHKHYEAIIDPKYTLTGFGIADTKIVEHFCQQ